MNHFKKSSFNSIQGVHKYQYSLTATHFLTPPIFVPKHSHPDNGELPGTPDMCTVCPNHVPMPLALTLIAQSTFLIPLPSPSSILFMHYTFPLSLLHFPFAVSLLHCLLSLFFSPSLLDLFPARVSVPFSLSRISVYQSLSDHDRYCQQR